MTTQWDGQLLCLGVGNVTATTNQIMLVAPIFAGAGGVHGYLSGKWRGDFVNFNGAGFVQQRLSGKIQAVVTFSAGSTLTSSFRGRIRELITLTGVSGTRIDDTVVFISRKVVAAKIPAKFEDVLTRLLDNLTATVSSQSGLSGAALRRQIGIVRTNFAAYLENRTFAAALLLCFNEAQAANVTLASLAAVRKALAAELPDSYAASALVQLATVYCLSAEAKLITAIEFVSRDDVEAMMSRMKIAFDIARDAAADAQDSATYQTLTFLSGALTQHLASTARPLPRMVRFDLPSTLPTLALSQRLYYAGDRSEELIDENHIVHPAFAPRAIMGLNA